MSRHLLDGSSSHTCRDMSENVLQINGKYAISYDARKRREGLSKNKHILDESYSDSESEIEDENAQLLTPKIDKKLNETLCRIKLKDPSLYTATENIFSDEDFECEDRFPPLVKPVLYKDMVREALVESGADVFDKEEDSAHKAVSYPEEQAALKKAFLEAAEGTTIENGVFLEKDSSRFRSRIAHCNMPLLSKDTTHKDIDDKDILQSFWTDGEMDEKEIFLRDYILTEGWREHSKSSFNQASTDVTFEEDQLHLEKVDRFEAKYNFRFEEEDGKQVKSFPRLVEGSVRKRDDKRKRKREEKRKNEEEAIKQRKQKLRRLKELKKEEINHRLKTIKAIAGTDTSNISELNLDADFDPMKHDEQMKAIFGDQYENEDEQLQQSKLLAVPNELEGILKDLNSESANNSKRSRAYRKITAEPDEAYAPIADAYTVEKASAEEWWMCDGCQRGIPAGSFCHDCSTCENYCLCKQCFRRIRHPHRLYRVRIPLHCKVPPNRSAEVERANENFEQNFNLDFDDIIAGEVPTRFKYKTVKPQDYGFTTADILEKSDKELNSVVSMKKLAPYRTEYNIVSKKKKMNMWFNKRKRAKRSYHQNKSACSS